LALALGDLQKEIIIMLTLSDRASPIANFRDFGGQILGDSRRVRARLLYRSGSLSALIPDDFSILDELGIKTVVDLRSVQERNNHPSEWNPTEFEHVASPIPDTHDMLREVFSGDIDDPQNCHHHFSAFYAKIPELYAEEFSKMFALLADGAVPLLVNCSAGKDRTGVAAALILNLLGVSKGEIVADYLATQDRLQNNPAFMHMLSGRIIKSYAALPKAAQNVLMGVHADHLNAAFSQIETDYGSAAGYFETRLSLSRCQQDQIRANLIESL
jgi:protein-tyrosine phosphatase